MSDIVTEIRFSARMLRRSPGFVLAAILTLALGIGANTAIFSIVDGVLLRPLPYPEPDRLVRVWESDRHSGTTREGASAPDFFDIRERSRTLAALAAFRSQPMNLSGPDGAERVRVTLASHELFPMLGAAPVAGRGFSAAEDVPGGARVAVLGERFWRDRFGGDPGAVGRAVRIDDEAYTIVGILPAEFDFPSTAPDLWVPLRSSPTAAPRGVHNLGVIARLAPDASLAEARTELAAIARRLEEAYPQDNGGRGISAEPLAEATTGATRPALLVLLAAVGVILLIGCANVANLLLARGAARAREVAVRLALGASGARLARQFATETLLLTLVAGAIGVGGAYWALDLIVASVPGTVPRLDAVAIDGRILAVVAGTLVVVGLVFGLVPTLQARRIDLQRVLVEEGDRTGTGGRGRQRLRSALVVAEIALAVVLVTGAGLLVRSFARLVRVDPGFQTENVVKFEYQLPATRYPQAIRDFPNYPEVAGFHAELLRRVGALPGVRSAALAVSHPLNPGWTTSFRLEGQSEAEAATQPEVFFRAVSPDYPRTVGVPLLRGRPLDERDGVDAPSVTLINDAFARRYFPGEDPVGERIEFWGRQREIVGVIGDERFRGLGVETPPAIYPPLAQVPLSAVALLVRTATEPATLVNAVRAEVRGIDPELAVYDVATLDEVLARSVAAPRFTMLLLALFAAAALAMAVVGVHGVLSYTVAQRTRELGVRMALGAAPGQVVALVVRQGVVLAAAGVGIGLAGAAAASRLLTGLLYGVGGTDPMTYAAVALILGAVALTASYLPARRATRIDPLTALRAE